MLKSPCKTITCDFTCEAATVYPFNRPVGLDRTFSWNKVLTLQVNMVLWASNLKVNDHEGE